MDTTIGIIGKLIKELRSKRGLTLDELAEKSDCTSGFISQLENNKAAPSLTTLYSIAEALSVNVIDFFPSPLAPSKVTRSDNRESFHFEGAAIVYSLLSAKFHHGALGIFLMTYHPVDQALPTDELRKHMGEEFVYVLDGALRLWIGEGCYDLYAGDSAHFLSTTKHRHKPKGRPPQPPKPSPRDKDHYNFTDPDSRIMKNSTNEGFDQHYNVQVAAERESLLIVSHALSNHPNDKQEAIPTLDAIAPELGKPEAAALDNGCFSETNIHAFREREVEVYIATGREPHHKDWHTFFTELGESPGEEASPQEKMAYKLQTQVGQTIYRLRKCTVEPVIGIIKEILGFRQFSLRGLWAAAGEWCLVCLAFNLKRLHTLYLDQGLI